MNFCQLNLFGILIQEPGTIISDLIMGAFCLIFFSKLLIRKEYDQQKHFSLFFLFLGISAFVAAFAHGFYYYFGIYLHKLSWIFSGFAIYFLQYGSANLFINKTFKIRFLYFIKSQLVIYIILLFICQGFLIVKLNFTLSLIGILTPVYLVDMIKNNLKHNLYIILGVFLAILPSIYHRTEFNFLYIFNMNDLSHFFLVLCLFFLFLGLKQRFYLNSKIN